MYNNPAKVKFEKFDAMPHLDDVGDDEKPAGFNTAMLSEIEHRLHINIGKKTKV